MPSPNRRRVVYAQNFLTSPTLVERLLDRSTIGPADTVYEIGPGTGVITDRLAARCRRVIAVEKDPILAARLRRRYAGSPHVTICDGDVLDNALPRQDYKVFASVPFNITAAIVSRLTAAQRPPLDSYLVVQREAAKRCLGLPRESLYSVLLKPWFEPTIVHRFKRTDFVPVPSVETVMLRLHKRGPPLVSTRDRALFGDFVVHAFTAWQPTLRDALRGLISPRQLRTLGATTGLDLTTPPTGVTLAQWLDLFHHFILVTDCRVRARVLGAERRLRQQQEGLHKMRRTRSRR